MLLGAHVSTSGGVENAPANATALGCETMQIFSKNQRQWAAKAYTPDQILAYKDRVASAGLRKVVVHDSYLINLGAPDGDVYAKSVAGFADEMRRCEQLGIPCLNFHPGAHMGAGDDAGIRRIADTLSSLLGKQADNPTMLLIENTAGQGSNVGYRFEQVAKLLELVGDERMGVCIDTQHTFAAGYDHRDENGYDEVFGAIDDTIGLKNVRAFHLNDSKTGLGSRVDRHEDLGVGEIGWGLFERLVNDHRFAGVPGILETPGGEEAWAKEIAKLKKLRGAKAPDRDRPG